MVKMTRLLKDYADAGALNDRLAVWGFVDPVTFLTKAGAVGVMFRLDGIDDTCLDHAERQVVASRFEQSLRFFDESIRVYQYLVKRPAVLPNASTHPSPIVEEAIRRRVAYFAANRDALFDYEIYIAVLYEGWSHERGGSALRQLSSTLRRCASGEWLSVRRSMTVLEGELERAVAHLHTKAQSFQAHLADTVVPRLLPKGDVFRMLRVLLNPALHKAESASLKYDTHLDFFAADSTVECERNALQIDGYLLKVLTMKDPPSRTFAHVLEDLHGIPSRFVACLEWHWWRIAHGIGSAELVAWCWR
jgi:hypothetical protein